MVVIVVVVAFFIMGGDPEPTVLMPRPSTAVPTAPTAQRATSAPAAPTAPAAQRATSAPAVPAPVPPPTSGDAIIFSEPDWTSVQVQNRVAQYIVEHGYGYSTGVMSGGTSRLFQSLLSGDIHVSMEIWLPLQADDWTNARSNGEVEYVGASMDQDWQSTFVIPAYLQEEYPGLDHVDDLKDPRYRELFATASSDGRARLVACVLGWACAQGNDSQIEGYGLTDHLQLIRPDSEEAMFDQVYRAYAKREPWLGYMWGTADPALLLDLVRLEETPYSDECWFTTRACAFKDTTILISVHPGLRGRAPDVVHLLENWGFDTADYKDVLYWMEDNGATVEQAALSWLNEEGDTWRLWLTAEAGKGVQAALDAGRPAEGWPDQ